MSVMQDLEDFVRTHRSCGGMSGDASPSGSEGYLLWVACESEERFERWVTPEVADEEMAGWERHLRN